jgi:hypothetical protein
MAVRGKDARQTRTNPPFDASGFQRIPPGRIWLSYAYLAQLLGDA